MVAIPFVKMVGAGNDFIVIQARPDFDYVPFTKAVCARQTGIGADGVLILDTSKQSDYRMRIINADGSEAEMCGNGARCLARYIALYAKPNKDLFGMETLAGEILAQVEDNYVRVRLSPPKEYRPNFNITVANQTFQADYIDTGVPHTVIVVDALQSVDVNTLGALIRHHAQFAPRGTNVNFIQRIADNRVSVRTYERGVEAETLACGTGAVASALIAYFQIHSDLTSQQKARMEVLTTSGEILEVSFDWSQGHRIDNVWLKGKAVLIAKGEYFYV